MTKISNNVHSCRQPMAAQRLETLVEASMFLTICLVAIFGLTYSIGRRVGILEAFAVIIDALPDELFDEPWEEPEPEVTPRRQRVRMYRH